MRQGRTASIQSFVHGVKVAFGLIAGAAIGVDVGHDNQLHTIAKRTVIQGESSHK